MKLNSRVSSELITWEDVTLKRKGVVLTNPLKLLRNFGHIIKNLRISFKNLSVKQCTEVENYLVRFCSESLQRFVVMCNTSKIIFKDLQKPLKNVTDLQIMMDKNQNLDHIRFLDENNLPNVNNVYISCYDELKDLTSVSGKLHYKNIEYFEISATRTGVYPFSFENLKHLTTDGNCIVNDALCEFIGHLNDLKTLKIRNTMFGFNLDPFRKILKLQNISSNIVELHFPYHPKISSNDVLSFLKQTRKLRKLSIPASVPFPYDSNFLQEITSNLDSEWTHHARDLLYKEPGYHHSDLRCLFIERSIDGEF